MWPPIHRGPSTTKVTASSKLPTEQIRAGVGVAQVQRQLGHASVVSPMLYTHLDVHDIRQSLDEVDAR